MNEQFAPIGDMITLIANHQAGEATVVLNEMLGARVTDALASHKQSIAQSLFVPSADALAEAIVQEEHESVEDFKKRGGKVKQIPAHKSYSAPKSQKIKVPFRMGKSAMREEAEQLDEISAATAYSAGRKRLAQGQGLTNASLDAEKDPKHAAYTSKQYAKQADTAFDKAKKNYGYALKKDKIGFHEEAEQLDELSRETLGSYTKKATGQAIMHAASLGNAKTKAGVQRAEKPLEKRSKGIFRAISKLAKEDVEPGV